MQKKGRILGMVFIVLAVVAVVFMLDLEALIATLERWVQSSGYRGLAGFIVVVSLMLSAGTPSSVLGPLTGALLGLGKGVLVFSVAGMLGTMLVFFIARLLLRDWVTGWIQGRPKILAIQQALERKGFLFLCLVRFLPLHSTITSSVLATTQVRVLPFFLSSCCQILVWFFFIYFGAVAAEVAGGETSNIQIVARVFGALMFIVAVVYVTRFARRALAEEVAKVEEEGKVPA